MDMWEQSVDPGSWNSVDKRPAKQLQPDLGDRAANTLKGHTCDERCNYVPPQRGPQ